MQDSDPTTVAYIVQVEPVVCTNPTDQGTYADLVLVPLTTPTLLGVGKQGQIKYQVPNTEGGQIYVLSDPPMLCKLHTRTSYENHSHRSSLPCLGSWLADSL